MHVLKENQVPNDEKTMHENDDENGPDVAAILAARTDENDDDDDDENDDEEAAPLTFAEAVEAIDDGSRISDVEAALTLRETMTKHVRSVISKAKGLTTARKRVAVDLVQARSLVICPNGLPDWGAATRAYALIADDVFNAAFGETDADLRRTERQAINTHVQRTFLEPGIRAWVLANDVDAGGNLRWTAEDDEMNTPGFIAAVRKQYKQARSQSGEPLTPPDLYLSPAEKAARSLGRGDTNGADAPLAAAMSGIERLAEVTPRYQALAALKAASDLVMRVTDGSEVKDRAEVQAILSRIANVTTYGVMFLASPDKDTTADRQDVLGDFWTSEDAAE